MGAGGPIPISFPASANESYTASSLFSNGGNPVRIADRNELTAAIRRVNQMFRTAQAAGVDTQGIVNPNYD